MTPSISDGAATPAALYSAQAQVTVTIGGQKVTLAFAGLTPVFNGLYHINVVVPPGTGTGENVTVTVSAAGQTSAQVVTAVR